MFVNSKIQPKNSFYYVNSDLPNTSIIYTLFIGMAYTLQARWRYIDVQNYPLLMAIWEYPFKHALATFLA